MLPPEGGASKSLMLCLHGQQSYRAVMCASIAGKKVRIVDCHMGGSAVVSVLEAIGCGFCPAHLLSPHRSMTFISSASGEAALVVSLRVPNRIIAYMLGPNGMSNWQLAF